MGYYSNVAITMKESSYKNMKAAAEKTNNISIISLIDVMKVHKADDYVQLGIDNVKWYDSLSEIAFVIDYLRKMEEADEEYHYIRIGEDADDYETYNNINSNHMFGYTPFVERRIRFSDGTVGDPI